VARLEEATAQFKAIARAYEVLRNTESRARYDAGGGAAGGGGAGQIDPDVVFAHVFGQRTCPAPALLWWPLCQLLLAFLIDFIGVATFFVPFVGEVVDLMWAPVSGWLIKTVFDDALFAKIGVLEELLPGTDVVPTATLAWLRQYWRYIPVWCDLVDQKEN
jgi:hypothetical protein